jgi:hypothetical protein
MGETLFVCSNRETRPRRVADASSSSFREVFTLDDVLGVKR